MGPHCDVYDLAAITRANYRLNELGIDTMSFGGTVACAMELAERGLSRPEETGGLDPHASATARRSSAWPWTTACRRGRSARSWPRAPTAWPPAAAARIWP